MIERLARRSTTKFRIGMVNKLTYAAISIGMALLGAYCLVNNIGDWG